MWSVYQRSDSLRAWRKVISPHLLDHLLMREGDAKKVAGGRSTCSVWAGWLASWHSQGQAGRCKLHHFSEDQAALFIVVKVTPEMLASDIQPSRLQRSVMKIHDLLELKSDVRTGLIAYAGSAHLVMPLTSDAGVINSFAAALEPDIMPMSGDEPAQAIALANQRLKERSGTRLHCPDHR